VKYFLSLYAKLHSVLSEGVEVFTGLDCLNTGSRVNHRIKENGMKQLSKVLMGFTLPLLNMQETQCQAGLRRDYLAIRRFWYIIFKNARVLLLQNSMGDLLIYFITIFFRHFSHISF
jgi:hypothetical protein